MRIKKFNGGAGAILCNTCGRIVKEGWADAKGYQKTHYDRFCSTPNRITMQEWESNKPLYCSIKCENEATTL